MLFVYALAAVVSFLMAGILKLIFAGVQMQKVRAEAPIDAPAEAPPEPGNAAPEKVS